MPHNALMPPETNPAMAGAQAPWWSGASRQQWISFGSAYLGWMLDIMDLMLFTMVIGQVMPALGIDRSQAGLAVSASLFASAFGGLLFGYLADRIGRARSMAWSVLCYAVGTALCGLSTSLGMLVVFRIVIGLGIGGEWSAGSALVSEVWPAQHRGKVIAWIQSAFATGYALAALLAAVIVPLAGWRWVFAAGLLPALLAVYVRRHVQEPEIWHAQTERLTLKATFARLSGEYRTRTWSSLAFTTIAMCGYWGLFTWIPTYLATPQDHGGAGLGLVKSTVWIVVMQVGAAIGFITFGYIADAIGRKATFVMFFVGSAVAVPVFAQVRDPNWLLVAGFVVAYLGTGFYSGFAPLFAELFPTQLRATAQGFVYNTSRAVSALAPVLIGIASKYQGVSGGLALTSGFFALSALIVVLCIPETRGVELE